MIEHDVIYGMPLKDWDKRREQGELLNKENIKSYKGKIGLYKIYYGSGEVYIGKVCELNNRGLYKRLNDYIRNSDSGRKSKVAKEIYIDLGNAKFDVLIVGEDIEAKLATVYLELYYINKWKPAGNIHVKISNK